MCMIKDVCFRKLENLLNFNRTKFLSFDDLGSNLVSIFIFSRASAGKNERRRRAVLDLGENGLKTARTSVMNRVIILSSSY
jgi:hypothetical protein